MKLIKPSYQIIPQEEGLNGIYKQIELAGRTCYKSEDKITETSAKDFVEKMIKSDHCYTGETEIFTEKGWVKFKNYSGEKVGVINKDISFKGFEIPSRIVKHSYRGNFYKYPSMGIEVTDGHKMFGIFREAKNNFYNNSNYNLFKCNTIFRDNNGKEKTLGERMFKSPKHCLKPSYTNAYGELVGFWLGDGCYSTAKNKLVFHLKKERKIKYLEQLCDELGYTFNKRKSDYYDVINTNIGIEFNHNFYDNGKKISISYFHSVDIGHSIIQGLIHSDGSLGINTKTITFTNTSKSIIDWLLCYAPVCGYTISNLGISKVTNSNNPLYKVLLLDTDYTINNDSRNNDTKVIITTKEEEVYCVTVSTGLILVRGKNGVTSICGNCAMLEHGTIYLHIQPEHPINGFKYRDNKYSKYVEIRETEIPSPRLQRYITTNLRILVENNWLEDLQYICEPTEYHEKRITVKFICDRGVSHEFVRHRTFSFAQESTRYCNYSKDKFGNELTFIIPCWLDLKEDSYESLEEGCDISEYKTILINNEETIYGNKELNKSLYLRQLDNSEYHYFQLLEKGWTPQQARSILPNSLKTELIMTGFVSDWEHFFNLRALGTTGKPHPQASELAIPLMEEFKQLNLL